MGSPLDKQSPLTTLNSGMFVRADGVRAGTALLTTAPEYLCLELVKRYDYNEVEITTAVQVRNTSLPALASLVLARCADVAILDRVIDNLPIETREALAFALAANARAEGGAR